MGGDYVDREGELIEVEVWDYHWVNAPSALTWISAPGSIPWCVPACPTLIALPNPTTSQSNYPFTTPASEDLGPTTGECALL